MGADSSRRGSPPRAAARIAGAYLATALLWLLAGDQIAQWVAPTVAVLRAVESAKGVVFVLITTGLLYLFFFRYDRGWAAAELALHEHSELLERILEVSPAGVTVVDRDGRITYANPEAEAILGLGQRDITTRTYDDPAWRITDPDGGEFPSEQLPFATVMRTGRAARGVQHAIEWPDGRRVSLEIHGAPLREASGTLAGGVFVIKDTTALDEAARAVAASEERYRGVFENALDAMVITDDEGRYVDFNPAACAMIGWTREQALGKHVWDLAPGGDDEQLRAAWREFHRDGRASGEIRLRRADGREILCEYQAAADVALGRHLSVLRDVTEERRMLAQAAERRRRLRRLTAELMLTEERERRILAERLHDELGAALTGLKLCLSALAGEHVAEPAKAEFARVLAIVDSLIEIARGITVELSPPVLHELGLDAALNWLGERFADLHGLPIQVVTDDWPKQLDESIEVLLFRAAGELLLNVVKHAQAGRAELTLRRDGRHVWLEVADDGVGFAPAAAAEAPGDRFGLFSLRERVEHFGGRVEIRSAPGEGTTVRLRVPMDRRDGDGNGNDEHQDPLGG